MRRYQLKRGEVVTVADVSDEDHVDNSLLQIWNEVWFKGLTLIQTLSTLVLKLKFRRDFGAEVWSVFCC